MNEKKEIKLKGEFIAVEQFAVLKHRGRYVGRVLKSHIDFDFPAIYFSRN